jgi:Chitobiase/beta-hexosaminidase C-terminal domain/Bacterial lectin
MSIATIIARSFRADRSGRFGFRLLLASLVALLAMNAGKCVAQTSVTTYHNDIGRTGQNLNETILTTSNVNATQFGLLFSQPVDGQIYAQPLYLPGLTIGGQVHNVVFVATENDSVYAFDADSNGGANASPLWQASMLAASHGAAAGATAFPASELAADISPLVGITGTPVIDPTTKTLYLVSKSLENGSSVQRLHALDVTTGNEKFGGPVVVTATVAGTGNGSVSGQLTFDSMWENQRPGLLLLNGIVYMGFAAHGDNGPWHGWILAYNAATLAQTGAFNATPNGIGGGFWMSGAGLAADQLNPSTKPYGRLFATTGNGDYTATTPYANGMDYGDTVVNLDLTNGVPTIQDEFTPSDQASLDAEDGDLGSGGTMLIPTQTTGSYPHLLVQTGKEGTLYLVNRDGMTGYNSTDAVVQEIQYGVGVGSWSTAAYWNGNVYYWGRVDTLRSFPLVNGKLGTPTLSSETYGYPGSTPSISANGTTQGIVWSIDSEAYTTNGPAVLQAHNASNVATTLYSSATNSSRDNPGPAVKFTVPTVVNGKVYVGTATQISVFGLLNGTQQAATPVITPGTESFTGSISVSITDSTPGATIYYTTNGTTPTTSSTQYSGSITVSSTETINAIASASNYLVSPMATATYTDVTQVNAPTFTPAAGTFTSTQTVTISDSTSGATIYYTTNGTTPTTSSTQYTGAITVSSTETIEAIAVASGLINSPVTTATYTIQPAGSGINYPQGFAASAGQVILNGNAQLDDSRLQLTDGGQYEASSAWYVTPVNIQSFVTNFTFQLSNPAADGITFAIQNNNNTIVGASAGNLGYGYIPNSIAIKYDLFNNQGEGPDSTGLYINGTPPMIPALDMTSSGVNLHSGDTMAVQVVYDGTTLSMTITDTVTGAIFSASWVINIPATVGGNTAYVGFTGASGYMTASQKILTWGFSNPATVQTIPTFSPAPGTYGATQTVSINGGSSGATVYYTTNGTAPTTSSTQYTGPITVSSTEKIEAIGVIGSASSAIAGVYYTITPTLPTPTFSPAAGTYSSAQTVTISDGSSGATIYYTTNGTTPTTSSTQYTGAITVSASETVEAIAVASGYTNSAVATAAYTISPVLPTPTFSPAAGTYTSTQTVTITDGSSGATIYYTTNGTTPTTSSTKYTGSITVSASETIEAIAVATGYTNSAVATAVYTIAPVLPTPTFSPAAGTYTSTQTVTISDGSSGATIYYTTNGTTPTTSSTKYTGAITVSASETIEAIAVATGYTNSAVATAAYTISPVLPTPTFSPAAGTYTSTQTVTITDGSSGATIYYTTNGTTPTTSSTKYTGSITVSASETIEAIAVATGYTNSAVATAAYTIAPVLPTPTFSPAAGTYTSAQTVTVSDGSSGATIYYTTNGTTPTTSSTKYTGSITVSASETIEAIAVASGYTNSAVATAAYTIAPVLPTPTFSPAAGTYASTQTVTVSDGSSGATIYYTTNGTTPTTSSTKYTGSITVSASETIEAIAVASGYTNSAVATAAYTISSVLPTPTFSPAAGSYTAGQSVTISDSNSSATIYYTTNGTTPTASSTKYTAPITLNASETIEAIAIASGYTNSAVATAAYTVSSILPGPTFSPAAGTYPSVSVTINDSVSTATIYYTTNGTTPTTSSTKYTGPFTLNTSAVITVKAIAVASGYTNSAVSSAVYTISPTLARPTFSPSPGTYTSSQSVTISEISAGAKVYYTTDGSTPTTSSALYSGAITVSSSETINAIAVLSGFSSSPMVSGTYTIQSTGTAINFGSGFASSQGMVTLNGTSQLSGSGILLTSGAQYQAGSAWYSTPINVQSFTTDFTFQLTNAAADGFTFAIQNNNNTIVGASAANLGYGYIANSVAVKFDLFSNAGEGPDSTGLFTDGAYPTVPAIDMTSSGVNLHSGDTMAVHIVYDGTNLSMTVTDLVTSAVFSTSWAINIPGTVGSNTAYIGFTGGTGYSTASQQILTWTYVTPS